MKSMWSILSICRTSLQQTEWQTVVKPLYWETHCCASVADPFVPPENVLKFSKFFWVRLCDSRQRWRNTTEEVGWVKGRSLAQKKRSTRYFGHKRPLVCVLSRASDTLARIRMPVHRLNVQMLYIAFIYNSRVSGRVCKKFYHFLSSWLKRRSAFHDITQCALFLYCCGCGGGFLSFSLFVGGILYSPLRGSDSSQL